MVLRRHVDAARHARGKKPRGTARDTTRRVLRKAPDGLAGPRPPDPGRRRWRPGRYRSGAGAVAAVGPQPGESLGRVDAGPLADHALWPARSPPGWSGRRTAARSAAGPRRWRDAQSGQVRERPGDDDVRLIHRHPGDAEQVQRPSVTSRNRSGSADADANPACRAAAENDGHRPVRPPGPRARPAPRSGRHPGTG
jgi:hypothetical protein